VRAGAELERDVDLLRARILAECHGLFDRCEPRELSLEAVGAWGDGQLDEPSISVEVAAVTVSPVSATSGRRQRGRTRGRPSRQFAGRGRLLGREGKDDADRRRNRGDEKEQPANAIGHLHWMTVRIR
jgi:hypothetical protein